MNINSGLEKNSQYLLSVGIKHQTETIYRGIMDYMNGIIVKSNV